MDTITTVAAWVGALGTVGYTLFEIYKHTQNKPKLKFRVGSDFKIIGSTAEGKMVELEQGKSFWSVNVANVGNKDVTITQLVIERHDTDKFSVITRDYNGDLPEYTLRPGKSYSYTLPHNLIPYGSAKAVHLMDAVGEVYVHRIDHKET